MNTKRLVIAGTESGVGKTTITIGIMSALIQAGLTVQGFKCGPDYIDPTYHTAITGRKSRNLDSWMLSVQQLKDIFRFGCIGSDIAIIEGVMGFYDGFEPKSNRGSTAEISQIIESPAILVINCYGMARSSAAVVKGYQTFSEYVKNIVGVIVNMVGSKKHFSIVKEVIEHECGIPVIGYLAKDIDIELPERHLGLIPLIEKGKLTPFFKRLGQMIAETIDIESLLELSQAKPFIFNISKSLFEQNAKKTVKIAVAKDEAFHFYYPENLEIMEAFGAEINYFSPLNGEPIPENVDGLYIGGGFPEEFAETLSNHENVIESIRQAIQKGMPTFAECGGFMFLTKSIELTDGRKIPMAGIIDGEIKMHKKLVSLGYREIFGLQGNFIFDSDDIARGHEFHYSSFHPSSDIMPAYLSKHRDNVQEEGVIMGNLVAGYTHIHFASCPHIVEKWINKCVGWKNNRKSNSTDYTRNTF
jgi:cobyrinic acid a,c-diamide synthase